MNGRCRNRWKIKSVIQNLELSGIKQKELDNKYNDLVTIIHGETNSKLTRRKVVHFDGLNDKRMKLKKKPGGTTISLRSGMKYAKTNVNGIEAITKIRITYVILL